MQASIFMQISHLEEFPLVDAGTSYVDNKSRFMPGAVERKSQKGLWSPWTVMKQDRAISS